MTTRPALRDDASAPPLPDSNGGPPPMSWQDSKHALITEALAREWFAKQLRGWGAGEHADALCAARGRGEAMKVMRQFVMSRGAFLSVERVGDGWRGAIHPGPTGQPAETKEEAAQIVVTAWLS
jgi:hypothetical protein